MTVALRELRVGADFDASRYTRGMAAKVAADKAGAASSREVGAAVTQTTQKVSQAGDPLARLSRQFVSGYRDTENFDRAIRALSRGVDSGNIPLDRAGAILDGIYAKYGRTANAAALLSRGQGSLASAVQAANTRYAQQAVQIDEVTAATMRMAAANSNVRGQGNGSLNSANIAAQLQDIAVTAQMGMSPIQIALQQGTQLSAALGNQGLRGTILALGTAFTSVLSPVSLLTIGTIALGTAGVQAMMGMMGAANDNTTALERNAEVLNTILKGYDDARQAAQDYVDVASRRPEGAVASDLLAGRVEALDGLQTALSAISDEQERIRASFGDLAYSGDTQTLAAVEGLAELGLTAQTTNAELDALVTSLTEMANDQSASAKIRKYATDLLPFVEGLLDARAEVGSFDAALRNLPREIAIKISMSQTFSDKMEELNALYMDPRSQFEVARENAQRTAAEASMSIVSLGQADAISADLQRVLSSIDAAEAKANAKRASGAPKTSDDRWGAANDNFQQRIDQANMEIGLLGKSTYEVERQKAAFDLLNQAKQAGIPITAEVTGGINRMANEYAAAQVQLEAMQEAERQQQEQMDFYRGTFRSFLSEFRSQLKQGVTLWDAFANAGANALDRIAERALGMAADGIFDMIFGAIGGALGGGSSLGGGWGIAGGFGKPGIFGIPGFASGTNAAPAGMAWVGESGPELVRFRGGQQVFDHQRSMRMAANQNFGGMPITLAPVYNFNGSGFTEAQARRLMAENNRQLLASVPGVVADSRRRASTAWAA